ncbi:hypothetical protein J6590_019217 [Homalodisca vitripennis]|nr:hypothetical protein J6590_019217 [Homalodisca vitripennis]
MMGVRSMWRELAVVNINHMVDSGINNNHLHGRTKVLNNGGGAVLARLLSWPNKEEVTAPEAKEQDEKRTTPEEKPQMYQLFMELTQYCFHIC